MAYVSRENGVITGVFAHPQPGFAEEWMDDDHPEVIAFLNPPLPPYTLQVSDIWTSMNDEEAEDFDAAMSTASPLRLRKAFNTASTLKSETELFVFVKSVLAGAITQARADEIMARPAQQAKAEEEE